MAMGLTSMYVLVALLAAIDHRQAQAPNTHTHTDDDCGYDKLCLFALHRSMATHTHKNTQVTSATVHALVMPPLCS